MKNRPFSPLNRKKDSYTEFLGLYGTLPLNFSERLYANPKGKAFLEILDYFLYEIRKIKPFWKNLIRQEMFCLHKNSLTSPKLLRKVFTVDPKYGTLGRSFLGQLILGTCCFYIKS